MMQLPVCPVELSTVACTRSFRMVMGLAVQRFSRRPWAKPLKDLREIEAALRNPVAHTIKNVDEAWLQRELSGTGINLKGNGSATIMRLLRDTVNALNADADNASRRQLRIDWGSYDTMNLALLDAMQ